VTFTDPSGESPESILLVIIDSSVLMKPQGEDHTSGVLYKADLDLPAGIHEYYFLASTQETTLRYPASDFLSVEVMEPLNPVLEDGKVSPTTGTSNEEFEFSVKYSDPMGLAPETIIVRIDGEAFQMSTKGTDHLKGVEYSFSRSLEPGNHSYGFFASNNDGSVRLPREPETFFYLEVEPFVPYEVLDEGMVLSSDEEDRFNIVIRGEPAGQASIILVMDDLSYEMRRIFIDETGRETFEVSIDLDIGHHEYHYEIIFNTDSKVFPEERKIGFEKLPVVEGPEMNSPPIAVVNIEIDGMNISFDASSSRDDDGQIAGYMWELDGIPHLGRIIDITFSEKGFHYGRLTVSDNNGSTDRQDFEIWVDEDRIEVEASMISSYFRVEEDLEIIMVTGNPGSTLKRSPKCDLGLRYDIELKMIGPAIVVMDLPNSLISCWEGKDATMVLNNESLMFVNISTLLSMEDDDHEFVSMMDRDETTQIIIRLKGPGYHELKLCEVEVEEKEDLELDISYPIITLATISIITIILLSAGTFILFRTRMIEGPRDLREEFIISSEGRQGNGFSEPNRKGKKIEWEAYLEE
jgi:hypothetical protein